MLILIILHISLFTTCVTCPLNCLCVVDDKSRRKVTCRREAEIKIEGALLSSSQHQFVEHIDQNTQILEITTQKYNNPNWLTISPAFQLLLHLEEFYIFQSNVQEISKHAFWGLKSLRVLNLVNNDIALLQDHNFKGLANLKEIYLDSNKIQRLLSGTFKYLTELRILSLAENQLENIEARVFERLGKLQKLNLSGNKLKELYPEAFMDIQELRIFLCRRCGLRNVNTQIYHLVPHLKELDLGENNFFYLSSEEFYDLRNLIHLWLDGNYLSVVLEKTFAMQQQLEMLSLARNRLAKVTNAAFANLTNLKDLNLSYNNLMRFEPSVFYSIAGTLERLDISGNKLVLAELKYTLILVKNLRYLGLAYLNISEIPFNLFDKFNHLKSLNVSGNNLEYVSKKIFKKLDIYELDLSRNKIKGLDLLTIEFFENIPKIYLNNNPFICNMCNILQVIIKLNQLKNSVNFRTLKCALPLKLKLRTFESLNINELMQCDHFNNTYELNYKNYEILFFLNKYKNNFLIIITLISVLIIFFGSIIIVKIYCFSKTPEFVQKDKFNFVEEQNEPIKNT